MPERHKGVERYTSTSRLSTSYTENNESRVRFAKRRAVLAGLVRIIGTILALNIAGNEGLYLPVSGGRYFPTGRDSSEQTGNNDFEILEGLSLEFFELASGSEDLWLILRFVSHKYMT